MTLLDRLRAQLPAELRSQVAHLQLELTPHRSERVILRGADESIVAIAHLDDPEQLRTIEQLRDRLGDWRVHLPLPLAELRLGARHAWIRAFRSGHTIDAEIGPRGLDAVAREGAQLLAGLQAATPGAMPFSAAHRAIWIEGPLATIERAVGLDRDAFEAARGAAMIVEEMDARPIPFAAHHGDYQFTNLIRAEDGELVLIDWELSRGTAPAAMDLVHYLIGLGVSAHGMSYGQSVAAALDPASVLGMLAGELWQEHLRAHPIDAAAQATLWVGTILHGTAHLARRVPHLFDRARQKDMLGAIPVAVRALGRA